jgi:hypothetical protein
MVTQPKDDTGDAPVRKKSARRGNFFHVPKDWAVGLGVIGDVFFNLAKNQSQNLLTITPHAHLWLYIGCYLFYQHFVILYRIVWLLN